MSKKPTLQDRYNKAITRLQNSYDSLLSSSGVSMPVEFSDIVGKKPARLSTEYVEKIEQITPSKLKSYAQYYDENTFDDLTYEEWREKINNPSVTSSRYVPSDIPTFDYYDMLKDRIGQIPDFMYTYSRDGKEVVGHSMDVDLKSELLGIVDDNLANDDTGAYAEYLEDNMEYILSNINMLNVRDMYTDVYEATIAKLYYQLNGGSITAKQQERSSLYGEAQSTYYGEDEE